MSNLEDELIQDTEIDEEILRMSTEDLQHRIRLLNSEIAIMRSEIRNATSEMTQMNEKIKENSEKIKVFKVLPYLVSTVVEILDMDPQDEEEEGGNVDLDAQRKGKCAVIKTSTRQTYFLPVIGLVDPEKLHPGDLVGVNKDSYLILDIIPSM